MHINGSEKLYSRSGYKLSITGEIGNIKYDTDDEKIQKISISWDFIKITLKNLQISELWFGKFDNWRSFRIGVKDFIQTVQLFVSNQYLDSHKIWAGINWWKKIIFQNFLQKTQRLIVFPKHHRKETIEFCPIFLKKSDPYFFFNSILLSYPADEPFQKKKKLDPASIKIARFIKNCV